MRSSSTSRRISIGGNALRDASSTENSRRNRRTSLGGARLTSSMHVLETPGKDRNTIIDDYRMQKRSRDYDSKTAPNNNNNNQYAVTASSPGMSTMATMLQGTTNLEGSTALERFRMRKHQKLQEQSNISCSNETANYSVANSASFQNQYTQDDTINFSSGGFTNQTYANDFATQRNVVSTRPPTSISSRRKSTMLPPSLSQESTYSHDEYVHQPELSQATHDTTMTAETLESVARVTEMQKRVDELMKEKMGITMAMAPLEARFRQKEDSWQKEQNRLMQEIDSLKLASRHADEKYRDLELQFEGKEEENRELRLQIRKESSSLFKNEGFSGGSGNYSRQLQNDREIMELRSKLQNLEEEMTAMRLSKVSVEKELHATKIELDAVIRSHEELQDEYDEVSKSRSDSNDIKIQLETLKTEHMATAAQLNAIHSDFAATKAASIAAVAAKESEHKVEVERLQFEMSVFKTRAIQADSLKNKTQEIEDFAILNARIEERDRKIVDLEKKCFELEAIRRQMHNRIQELRGNIRVFVRARPFLPNDGACNESAIDVSPDGESLQIVDYRSSAYHDFKFDKVFPPSAFQDQVFDEVSDFVQSALDGYNVCLFSYGQTGSGKTHTMQGSGNGAMRGIIPRAVEKILSQVKVMQGHKWNFKVSASFLEIYNEELKDLLCTSNGSKAAVKKLAIKRSREGNSFVEGLSEIPIDTLDTGLGMQQLDDLMSVAARVRSVACTKMNSESSRSHSVFMLHLRGYNEETAAEVQGTLNLCDLAGSERLDRSGAGADAQRLRETQAINKSLSCLGDVFNALSQGSSHIPFRNSKLTYLLQDCLSGDGKALMFVNLSPTTASSGESLCSLRFAQRVNQVELGKATKHIQYRTKR